jgi:hypothetical protein
MTFEKNLRRVKEDVYQAFEISQILSGEMLKNILE